jgi:hypothetical protein
MQSSGRRFVVAPFACAGSVEALSETAFVLKGFGLSGKLSIERIRTEVQQRQRRVGCQF